MILSKDGARFVLVYPVSRGQGQHVSNGHGNGGGGCWSGDAKSALLGFVNGGGEENGIWSVCQEET